MVADIGRNAPCPCGSGKKYKRCCLDREAVVPFTARDREAALIKLTQFAFRPELEDELLAGGVEFWTGWVEAHADNDGGKGGMELDESRDAFAAWFALDFKLADGSTVVERMLTRQSAGLARGEREYLRRMRESHVRPYQVTDVRPGAGVRLIDLWAGRQVWVQERRGDQLVRWDLLALRLMTGPEGHAVIEGLPYLYPLSAKRPLLRALRRAHRELRRAAPFASSIDFFKHVAPGVPRFLARVGRATTSAADRRPERRDERCPLTTTPGRRGDGFGILAFHWPPQRADRTWYSKVIPTADRAVCRWRRDSLERGASRIASSIGLMDSSSRPPGARVRTGRARRGRTRGRSRRARTRAARAAPPARA